MAEIKTRNSERGIFVVSISVPVIGSIPPHAPFRQQGGKQNALMCTDVEVLRVTCV